MQELICFRAFLYHYIDSSDVARRGDYSLHSPPNPPLLGMPLVYLVRLDPIFHRGINAGYHLEHKHLISCSYAHMATWPGQRLVNARYCGGIFALYLNI